MRIRALPLMLALAVLCLTAGEAGAKGEYATRGIHVKFQGLFAIPTYADVLALNLAEGTGQPTSVSLGMSGGFDMRAGYRFHERVDFEMGFEYVAPYSIQAAGIGTGEASSWMYYVDFRVFVLTDRVQPYLLLGMGAYNITTTINGIPGFVPDGTDFAPRFGAGLDYHVDYRWGLTGEVNYVIGTRQLSQRDRLAISLGAFYRF